MLCAQLSDWRKFRAYQSRSRRHQGSKPFGIFTAEAHERRRRYGVGGGVRLSSDPKQQSAPETWTEYQNYHLTRLEQLEAKQSGLQGELDETQKRYVVANNTDSRCVADDAEAVQQVMQNVERDLKRHKVLLQWIEHERRIMYAGYSTLVGAGSDDRGTAIKPVRRTRAHCCRETGRQNSEVLGKVRITKIATKKRKAKTRDPTVLGDKVCVQDADAIPEGSLLQIPERREPKPQRIEKGTQLHQDHPQKSYKANRLTGAKAKSILATRRSSARQTWSIERDQRKGKQAAQRPHPTPVSVTTRSGRISKRPVNQYLK